MSANYEAMRRPPKTALREIQAGDLKGKTDINPQWRYEIMDQTFGACGVGWKYEVVKLWDVPCADGTVLAFAQVNVYTKNGTEWSDPIPGIGGNTLVDMVKGYTQGDPKRAKPNDEGYKMAVTDALSVALKMLGVAADIYAGLWDGSKYRDNPKDDAGKAPAKPAVNAELKAATVALEAYIASGTLSGDEAKKAQSNIDSGNLVNINKWIEYAKQKESPK